MPVQTAACSAHREGAPEPVATGTADSNSTAPLVNTRPESQPQLSGSIDLAIAADATRAHRQASLHALHVLEYALAAPAPRRQRTWLHRVTAAVDALAAALDQEIDLADQSFALFSEIAASEPRYSSDVAQVRQERLDLRIAVSSLREHIEPDAEKPIDPADIRDRLAKLAQRYRAYCARESDIVYQAVEINLNDEPKP